MQTGIEIDAVVFDWDGTLMDSRAAIVASYREATEEALGRPFPVQAADIDEIIQLRGRDSFRLIAGSDEELAGRIAAAFHLAYRRHQQLVEPFDGAAVASLELTLEYAAERQAFGRPIGSFQHKRFTLAEAVTEVQVTQTSSIAALREAVAGRLTAVDAAKTKWWTSEVQNRVIDSCVQIHGGYGYMQEYEVARAWCDARVTRIWAGTTEIMKEIVGRPLGFGDPR